MKFLQGRGHANLGMKNTHLSWVALEILNLSLNALKNNDMIEKYFSSFQPQFKVEFRDTLKVTGKFVFHGSCEVSKKEEI